MKSIRELIIGKELSLSIILLYSGICGLFITLILIDYEGLWDLIKEDGLMEYIEVLFYGIASSIFFYLCLKIVPQKDYPTLGKIFYIGFFLLFFLVMMEELSWGQRLFNINTPENMKEINFQDETNVHNIGGTFQPFFRIVMGLFLFIFTLMFPILNLTSRRFNKFINFHSIPVVQKNLIIGFALSPLFVYIEYSLLYSVLLTISLLIPLALTLIFRKHEEVISFDFPVTISFIFFLVGVFVVYITFLPKSFKCEIYEVREFLYGLSFLIFSILLVYTHQKEDTTLKEKNTNSDQHNSI